MAKYNCIETKDDYLELDYSGKKPWIVFTCKQGNDTCASVLELKDLISLKQELEEFINKRNDS